MTAASTTWKDRVYVEQSELIDKLVALRAYIRNGAPGCSHPHLLTHQVLAMNAYLLVLKMRLEEPA